MYSLVLATALRKAALGVRAMSFSLPAMVLRRGLVTDGQCVGEALFEPVEAFDGACIGVVAVVPAGWRCGRGDHQVDLLLDVVEGEDLVEEHEAGVGDAELVGGEGGEHLDLADDVVGEKPTAPA